VGGDTPGRTERFLAQSCLSAGIDTRPVGGPQAPDDTHRGTTRWAQGDTRWRGDAPPRLAIDGLSVHAHLPEGGGREGRAGVHTAAVADFPEAIGEAMREEPAEQCHDVELGGRGRALPGGREGTGTVRSVSAPRRLVAMATVKTEGAREGKAAWLW
jgi:hypothetical protein